MYPPQIAEILLSALRQFFLFAALLWPIELLFPAQPKQRLFRRGLTTDLLYFFLNSVLLSFGLSLVIGVLNAGQNWLIPQSVLSVLRSQPFWIRTLGALLCAELLGYIVHRLCHEVPFLWRLHRIHHSSAELDFIAAHRQHPLEALLLLTAANIPVLVLGLHSESLLIIILLQKFHTAFVHSNTRISFGRLSLLLASPQFHHLHHDACSAAPGCNFSSLLPIFDWLCGTYRKPPKKFPTCYGVADAIPSGYWKQCLSPLRS